LKAAATGAAGASLLGVAGCRSLTNTKPPHVPDEYLPGGQTGPNVILVIVDSLRRDHVGAYGNDWIHTPTLDALSEESLLFTRAQPEAMPTLPVRRAIYLPALLRLDPDPPRADHGGRDTLERGLRHLPGYRHLRPVPSPHELRPGLRNLPENPGPGEGRLQGPFLHLRGRDAPPLPYSGRRQQGPPVPGQRAGPPG
jgi:hypothetical protein